MEFLKLFQKLNNVPKTINNFVNSADEFKFSDAIHLDDKVININVSGQIVDARPTDETEFNLEELINLIVNYNTGDQIIHSFKLDNNEYFEVILSIQIV